VKQQHHQSLCSAGDQIHNSKVLRLFASFLVFDCNGVQVGSF